MDPLTVIAAAAEAHEEHNETAFIVAGLLLAAFGVLAGAVGILRPNLSENASRLISLVCVVLVISAMAAMIIVS
jgi:hypothetical protein